MGKTDKAGKQFHCILPENLQKRREMLNFSNRQVVLAGIEYLEKQSLFRGSSNNATQGCDEE